MDRRLISQLVVLTTAAVLQSVSWLTLGGIRVNFVLITLLAFVFIIKDWRCYLILVFWSALILRVGDDWNGLLVGLTAIPLVFYLIKKFLPWRSLINYLVFVILATIGFYSLVDWPFLFNSPRIFFNEIIYNLLFGSLIYLILARFYA